MTTAERLRDYYDFAPDVIDEVAEFAEFQASFENYRDFFGAVGVPNIEIYPVENTEDLSVVDVRPKEHDEKSAIIMHLPMANPLDANQLYQVATIAGTNPDSRVIAFGNPSGGRYKGSKLTSAAKSLLASGDLFPLVGQGVDYVEKQGIEEANEIGYSYGALKSVAAAYYGMYSVSNAIAIEPVSHPRSLLKLGTDFMSTDKALSGYTNAPGLDTYKQARKDAVSMKEYMAGLLGSKNRAVAGVLAKTDFKTWADQVLTEGLVSSGADKLTLVWGSESELADDETMQQIVYGLKRVHGDRVSNMRLEGQKHALANDVHLHAAIIKQALK